MHGKRSHFGGLLLWTYEPITIRSSWRYLRSHRRMAFSSTPTRALAYTPYTRRQCMTKRASCAIAP
eukprot:scaffold202186_cov35-Tisochrysis_lutea.AAC.3